MMRFALVVSFLVVSVTAFAQQGYYIFLQTDDQQPFYARIGQANYSATATGYLIIPSLKDSTYDITIGFPKSMARYYFSLPVNKTDQGYTIQKNAAGDYELYNWLKAETVAQHRDKTADAMAALYGERKNNDAFALLMAAVVNDSAVLYNSVVKAPDGPAKTVSSVAIAAGKVADSLLQEEEKKTIDSGLAASPRKVDTVITARTTPANETDSVVATSTPVANENIVKLQEQKEKEGHKLVFIDKVTTGSDTIDIIIRADSVAAQKDSGTAAIALPDTAKTTLPVVSQPPVKDTVIEKTVVAETKPADSAAQKAAATPVTYMNSDCVNFASDYDVDKLRVKLLAENTMEDRLAVARKVFRSKCFTTKQVRALTELFVTDETRFKFFDAAYAFVSDSQNFRQLINLLSDEVFINRFKALVRM